MTNSDAIRIRELIESWAASVRKRDFKGILAHHTDNIVMYDVPEPFQSKGIKAYKKTWDLFFSWAKDSRVFDILKLTITVGDKVAFAYATMRCTTYNAKGKKETLKFRLTIGLEKIDGQWMVTHEHHSVPAE